MKISFIIPNYNQGGFISKAIESIICQNAFDYQIIIMDGGSNDNSISEIERYQKFIDRWVSENDNGQSNAINKGLKYVNGDYWNWLCADDYLSENFTSFVLSLNEQKDYDLIVGNLQKTGVHNGIFSNLINFHRGYAFINSLKQPATFFKTSLIDKLGSLNEDLHYIMDYEYLLRYILYKSHNFCFYESSEIIAFYLIHNLSKSGSESLRFIFEKAYFFYSLAANHQLNGFQELYELFFSTHDLEPKEIILHPIYNDSTHKEYFLFLLINHVFTLSSGLQTRNQKLLYDKLISIPEFDQNLLLTPFNKVLKNIESNIFPFNVYFKFINNLFQ